MDYKFHKSLEILSILYLGCPIALFAVGWLKPIYAVIMVGALGIAVYTFYRSIAVPTEAFSFKAHPYRLIICIALLLLWVTVSGAGGIARQTLDYNKHNALMSDLVTHSWPVEYQTNSGKQPLVYYVAYYLPAAAAGKLVSSTNVADLLMLPWAGLGVLLAFYWLCRITNGPKIWRLSHDSK